MMAVKGMMPNSLSHMEGSETQEDEETESDIGASKWALRPASAGNRVLYDAGMQRPISERAMLGPEV
jgi:hypothetical protein